MYKHLIYMYKDTHVRSSSHFSPSCHEMHHMYSQRLYPIICLTKSDVCPKKLTHAGQIIWNAIIFFVLQSPPVWPLQFASRWCTFILAVNSDFPSCMNGKRTYTFGTFIQNGSDLVRKF